MNKILKALCGFLSPCNHKTAKNIIDERLNKEQRIKQIDNEFDALYAYGNSPEYLSLSEKEKDDLIIRNAKTAVALTEEKHILMQQCEYKSGDYIRLLIARLDEINEQLTKLNNDLSSPQLNDGSNPKQKELKQYILCKAAILAREGNAMIDIYLKMNKASYYKLHRDKNFYLILYVVFAILSTLSFIVAVYRGLYFESLIAAICAGVIFFCNSQDEKDC